MLLRLFLLLISAATAAPTVQAENFSYIYRYGDQTHIRSSMGIEKMVKLSKRWTGEYVWLRRQGKDWLIRDAGVLAEVRTAFADMHAFEPRLRAAVEKRRPYERKMEAIERRMDRISDRLSDEETLTEATRQSLEKQLREVEREMEAIESTYNAMEREAEAVEEEMDRLEAIAERKFEKIVIRAVEAGKAERVDS